MFKRLIQALNDNAQMIHEIACGANPQDYCEPNPPLLAIMHCRHCGCEVEPDADTHVCTSLKIPN